MGALISLCAVLPGWAEKPKVDGVFPAGGMVGSKFEVTVTGSLDPWPLEAVCDSSALVFAAKEKEKGVFEVTISPEASVGAHLVRFFNKEGATVPRNFVVGSLQERAQNGKGAHPVAMEDLPLTVNGKLEAAGEVDRFALELAKDQLLVAEVAAYVLDSPLDPLLHMRGPRGEQLAFNHDANRLGLDPRLVFRAPAAGKYELHLSAFAYPPRADIRFTGGASSIYRLTLSEEAPVLSLPGPREADGEKAQELALPARICGAIAPAGDVDRYTFGAKKGEVIRVEVAAAELGSWMDAVLVLKDSAGKELKRMDDIDSKTQWDVALDWTAPADGEFTAEVSDLNGRGGAEIAYEIRITKPTARFELTADGGVYAVTGGAKLEIEAKLVRRYGYKGEIELGIEGLPPGVTTGPVEFGKKGEAKVVLEAAPDAASANVPITIWAKPKGDEDPTKRVLCRFEVKGVATDAGDLLINVTPRGWLTVIEKGK